MALKVDRVSKTFPGFKLNNINFEVDANDYFVLLGPTGAGKTVLLEVIMGFHYPNEGGIFLDGKNITDIPTEKRGIGYVPQNCQLFPHMSIFENVEFGLKMQGIASAERRQIVNGILQIMDLEDWSDRTTLTLSGGERQKVILARALAPRPKILLLDEPLTAIDPETGRVLREELKRINREYGVAIVHVTHDQIEAFSLGDRIAIMRNGQIVQLGHRAAVLSNPANEFVARFLGNENVARVRFVKHENDVTEGIVGNVVVKLTGNLESDEVTIMVRPEDILVTTDAQTFPEKWNVFEGLIKSYVDLGSVVQVKIDVGLTLEAVVNKRTFIESNLASQKHVQVGFAFDSVKVIGTPRGSAVDS